MGMPDGDDAQAARKTACHLLARREHSVYELTNKLTQRGFELETVKQVVQQLSSEGLQDQNRYVESYIRSRIDRGYGPFRIRNELQQRGVEAEQISIGFEALEVDWEQLALNAYEKRYGESKPSEFKERMRRIQFLRYRGFEEQQIRAILPTD